MIARTERADRPLVASMSDLAASGGYYIAMPAQAIVAQPSTLTGSIGIFGGKFVTGGVYEKLGREHRGDQHRQARRDELAGAPVQRRRSCSKLRASSCRPSTTSSSRRSATSRHTTPEKIDALAQGRVWTGRQAKEIGLVDELGGLDRALAIAKAAREDPGRQRRGDRGLPAAEELLRAAADQFGGATRVGGDRRVAVREPVEGRARGAPALRGPLAMFRRGEPLALMPFTFVR